MAALTMRSLLPSAPYIRFLFQKALDQAQDLGETVNGFVCFPVVERQDDQGNVVQSHEHLPFKTLKKLKLACSQYGHTAPFTLNLLESIGAGALPSIDCKAIAGTCLSRGDYLVWKSEFYEKAAEQAERNQQQQVVNLADMLTGEGHYAPMAAQLGYQRATYQAINQPAIQAWICLPAMGTKTEELSRIRQGPDEPFHEFVSRLLQAVGRIVVNGESGTILVKQHLKLPILPVRLHSVLRARREITGFLQNVG